MSTYVVGDIQGCYKPLKKLLKKINFLKSKAQLWCVGDLINRGPNSLDTLRFLQDLDQKVVFSFFWEKTVFSTAFKSGYKGFYDV